MMNNVNEPMYSSVVAQCTLHEHVVDTKNIGQSHSVAEHCAFYQGIFTKSDASMSYIGIYFNDMSSSYVNMKNGVLLRHKNAKEIADK